MWAAFAVDKGCFATVFLGNEGKPLASVVYDKDVPRQIVADLAREATILGKVVGNDADMLIAKFKDLCSSAYGAVCLSPLDVRNRVVVTMKPQAEQQLVVGC